MKIPRFTKHKKRFDLDIYLSADKEAEFNTDSLVNSYGFQSVNVHGLSNCPNVKKRFFWISCEQSNQRSHEGFTTISSYEEEMITTAHPLDVATTLLTRGYDTKQTGVRRRK